MKHVGKIYMLLGIIFICLVIPVNTNEGFKRFSKSKSKSRFRSRSRSRARSTNSSNQNYENSIKSKTCEELKSEKAKYPSGSYQHIIAKNMYTSRNCKEIEELKEDIKEVDERALTASDIPNGGPSSVN